MQHIYHDDEELNSMSEDYDNVSDLGVLDSHVRRAIVLVWLLLTKRGRAPMARGRAITRPSRSSRRGELEGSVGGHQGLQRWQVRARFGVGGTAELASRGTGSGRHAEWGNGGRSCVSGFGFRADTWYVTYTQRLPT